jgi:hypothetical protein
MRNKTQCFYTIGRVISEPAAHVSKDAYYLTSYVELFGGMKVSALAGKQEYKKGIYVGVRITPKGNGEATYHAFEQRYGCQFVFVPQGCFPIFVHETLRRFIMDDLMVKFKAGEIKLS